MLLLDNTRILTPHGEIHDGFIILQGKIIHFVGDKPRDNREYRWFENNSTRVIDLQGKLAVPGFIDIHTHGALGKDYSSAPELLYEDARFRITKGVTGFVPTIGSFVPPEKLLQSAATIAEILREEGDRIEGARPLGINLEGPALRPDIGAQPDEYCVWTVDIAYIKRAKELLGDHFAIMTIAPELENGLEAIGYLRENGVVPSIGHTLASEEQLDKAIRRGAALVTHLFNTTYQPEQDVKGVIKSGVNEYLLIRDDIMAEAIMDLQGVHINPTMCRILFRCKGIDKTVVVTDSFITPGTEPGKIFTMPNGEEVFEENGVNIQVQNRHVSGSAMTLDQSVTSAVKHTGVSLADAVKMVTINPATVLNVKDKRGSIEVGKYADVAVIDEHVNVFATIVEGQLLYNNL
jgi:N-acetylglucosamine-6-phosphate deacetylase